MIRKLFIVLLLSSETLGEAKESFLSFPNVEKTEILFFTKTEETVVVRSSYRGKQPNSNYLFVQLEDPKMLQVVNVTKTSSDVTNFTINLVTVENGETNLTIQLWDSAGRQERLIEEIKNVRVRVLKPRQDNLLRASNLMDRNILMLFLPMILLNKCAFGCKIKFQVFQMLSFSQSDADLASAAPFTVAMCCGCEMLLILLLYKAKRCVLIIEKAKKSPDLIVMPGSAIPALSPGG